jgi:hypothetical protein
VPARCRAAICDLLLCLPAVLVMRVGVLAAGIRGGVRSMTPPPRLQSPAAWLAACAVRLNLLCSVWGWLSGAKKM